MHGIEEATHDALSHFYAGRCHDGVKILEEREVHSSTSLSTNEAGQVEVVPDSYTVHRS